MTPELSSCTASALVRTTFAATTTQIDSPGSQIDRGMSAVTLNGGSSPSPSIWSRWRSWFGSSNADYSDAPERPMGSAKLILVANTPFEAGAWSAAIKEAQAALVELAEQAAFIERRVHRSSSSCTLDSHSWTSLEVAVWRLPDDILRVPEIHNVIHSYWHQYRYWCRYRDWYWYLLVCAGTMAGTSPGPSPGPGPCPGHILRLTGRTRYTGTRGHSFGLLTWSHKS